MNRNLEVFFLFHSCFNFSQQELFLVTKNVYDRRSKKYILAGRTGLDWTGLEVFSVLFYHCCCKFSSDSTWYKIW
jgi:hypothetical protein